MPYKCRKYNVLVRIRSFTNPYLCIVLQNDKSNFSGYHKVSADNRSHSMTYVTSVDQPAHEYYLYTLKFLLKNSTQIHIMTLVTYAIRSIYI